jgi:hypothetical protein
MGKRMVRAVYLPILRQELFWLHDNVDFYAQMVFLMENAQMVLSGQRIAAQLLMTSVRCIDSYLVAGLTNHKIQMIYKE